MIHLLFRNLFILYTNHSKEVIQFTRDQPFIDKEIASSDDLPENKSKQIN
ncbi:unnamed protein product [Lupinus luteus]|uniref:Uncharacterized protein n=1 Tax=Lupinus luteus TaxID=3873 RepID=A0AAV1X8P9_LUPLU